MKSRMNAFVAAALLALGAAVGASAQQAAPTQAAPAAVMTAGEVRKVDAAQSKVTIKHDAITNLDMPPMTMVFRAEKPELLAQLKAGDKVRFHAESKGGALVVTEIQADK